MGLRIFSGSLKGTSLLSLKGSAVRPTSGRVREAIFNILSRKVQSVSALDLFAGSGALGIEALSRGARFVVFMDEDPKTLSIVQKNLQRCRLEDRSKVIRWDLRRNLYCLSDFPDVFELVFMDPPYHQGAVSPVLRGLDESRALRKGAKVVVEHGFRELLPELSRFPVTDRRKYGKTLVSFLEYVV